MLAGSLGEDLLRLLLAEHNLEKLALYWAKGGTIPWSAIHEDGPFRLISLPTYPFAREHYWVQTGIAFESGTKQRLQASAAPASGSVEAQASIPHNAAVVASENSEFTVHPERGVSENMQRYLVWFLSQEAGLSPDQIKPGKGLRSYGVDSIARAKLLRDFEKYFQVRVTGRELLEHGTIESLVVYLAGKTDTMDGPMHTVQPRLGNGIQARAEYMDAQVIEALEQLKRGALDLEAVQRIIGD